MAPFDPFYAEELIQIRGFPGFNYKLRLSNITESGWTLSKVTDFRSDFKNYQIQYDQYFPDKRLAGSYEFYGNVVGNKMAVKGVWTLGLFGYTQTTTVTRLPRLENGEEIFDTPLKVEVNLKSCEKLQLHISDLLGGRRLAGENFLFFNSSFNVTSNDFFEYVFCPYRKRPRPNNQLLLATRTFPLKTPHRRLSKQSLHENLRRQPQRLSLQRNYS